MCPPAFARMMGATSEALTGKALMKRAGTALGEGRRDPARQALADRLESRSAIQRHCPSGAGVDWRTALVGGSAFAAAA